MGRGGIVAGAKQGVLHQGGEYEPRAPLMGVYQAYGLVEALRWEQHTTPLGTRQRIMIGVRNAKDWSDFSFTDRRKQW